MTRLGDPEVLDAGTEMMLSEDVLVSWGMGEGGWDGDGKQDVSAKTVPRQPSVTRPRGPAHGGSFPCQGEAFSQRQAARTDNWRRSDRPR